MTIRIIVATVCIFFSSSYLPAQSFPDKIRGYKVQKTKIKVEPMTATKVVPEKNEVLVAIRDIRISVEGLIAATMEIDIDLAANVASGNIDLITFRDIKVNGNGLELSEFNTPFEIKRKQKLSLPKPLHGSIPISGKAILAYGQLMDKQEKWTITGTVFVFGKFRKFGFKFKRVVPILIELQIDNPLAT